MGQPRFQIKTSTFKQGGEMADKTTITGTVDKKPLPAGANNKVQEALKSALQSEFTVKGTHHIEFTHIEITWDQV
jgi:hypothetical protein